MKPVGRLLAVIVIVLGMQACTPSLTPPTPDVLTPDAKQSITLTPETPESVETQEQTDIPSPHPIPANENIQPENLEYLGAFRLPDGNAESGWEYSGQGLTYFAGGDSNGAEDGFTGSLFGIGNDQKLQVSEISIPAPIISRNLDDLNTATTLQGFTDITGEMFNLEVMDLPIADLAYLPSIDGSGTGKLHFVFGQHFQEFNPSNGWHDLHLSSTEAAGPWIVDSYTNYVTSDYLFDIPENWAEAIAPGQRLATGRFREGGWGGGGPALFAYNPGSEAAPPVAGTKLTEVTPLLLYGVQEPGMTEIVSNETMWMNGYQLADHWSGGAWLSAGNKGAVIFVGTKALGQSWYGFANGVTWAYDCADHTPPTCPEVPEWPYENRGYWAEDYQAQIIFFNPAELAAVARGDIQTWEPQPYATLVLDDYLFNPEINPGEYKRDLVGAVAFDREHGRLYVVERLADGYKSVIHVWAVNP